MKKTSKNTDQIKVNLKDRSYSIIVGENLILNSNKYIKPFQKEPRLIVITDENVAQNWLSTLENSFQKEDIDIHRIILPPGESSKSLENLEKLVEKILSIGITRKSTLLALGGGVIGDITGFAASILLRGIDFIQLPTTLLAQVDSSVGGKTAVNSAFGKNLLGTFHQPRLVLADTTSLETLPKRELLAGYSELVKHGLVGDQKFFEWCEKNGGTVVAGDLKTLKYSIIESCRIKSKIVSLDEKEKGLRSLLNFGHTFGHALEAEANYSSQLLHGEAVAVGMILALQLSKHLGLCHLQDVNRVKKHFQRVGLPTKLSDFNSILWNKNNILLRMQKDKKVIDGKIVFILAKSIGNTFLSQNVSVDDLKTVLESAIN